MLFGTEVRHQGGRVIGAVFLHSTRGAGTPEHGTYSAGGESLGQALRLTFLVLADCGMA